jgi:hypothetical protein
MRYADVVDCLMVRVVVGPDRVKRFHCRVGTIAIQKACRLALG